jgi:catechol 2,3-dioxygenase-like lactoylglutathione lyase family enzyme
MSSSDVPVQTTSEAAQFPHPDEGILVTHFIVSDDVEASRRFYTDVLGGVTVRSGEPAYVALANSWIIINRGGGPTDDKPTVTLETPRDRDRASSFLNIRVADIRAVYSAWTAHRARDRDPLLPARSRRLPDRGRPDDPPARRPRRGVTPGDRSALTPVALRDPASETGRLRPAPSDRRCSGR